MSADTIELGDATITRVVEWIGPFAPARGFVPDATDEDWQAIGQVLPTAFWDAQGIWRCAMQSWVLRSRHRLVVVDTCLGHYGSGEPFARIDHSSASYLDNLARAGVDPGDVDVVVNTHLHQDHVGWNTRLVEGEWVPTFPNAVYLMTQADIDYLDPERSPLRAFGDAVAGVLRDFEVTLQQSVEPLLGRGHVRLWEGSHRIDDGLFLEQAPGHTPGSAVLRLESEGERALFIGDVVHIPVQIVAPDANSSVCIDPAEARRTRRRLLGEAADSGALVVPAHFVGPGALEVQRHGDTFAVRRWAPLANR